MHGSRLFLAFFVFEAFKEFMYIVGSFFCSRQEADTLCTTGKALTPILEDVVILEKNKAAAEDEPV